jgi:hypothetical protein
LRGIRCLSIEQCPQQKKSVTCSRSFGALATSLDDLRRRQWMRSTGGTVEIRFGSAFLLGSSTFYHRAVNPFLILFSKVISGQSLAPLTPAPPPHIFPAQFHGRAFIELT